ncbi:helix-turn-helix transcriptional regulator [Micrococcus cohnii]|uniref:DNA-binding transcriptional ArsR family regulator n=1 Tax=Micrococcus cohnii TaxID=993416 RepID=A0A7W7GQ36_9MICC|nr:metalloregulator ArsR/SmtB family transcription factor [Micrococcus cohnii]MBB4736121.1 DNA-binding transcriptional ArsR family regulator [Micrococcus cohnii]
MPASLDVASPQTDLSARDHARLLTPLLKSLADENRLTLMLTLADGPHTNKQLQEATGLSQALVSHHIATLRTAGLISVLPEGRSNLYAICCEQLAAPVQWLAHLATLTPEGQRACCTTDERGAGA